MSSVRTRAIVLRRTNYGEADRILELLTPEGKVSVIARGVRREKSRLAGAVELFAVSDVVVQRGRGDLGVLTAARLITFYGRILADYDALQFGYEALRQIAKLSESSDEETWFRTIHEVLEGLNSPVVPLLLAKTWFLLRIAALSGHELNLQSDYNGVPLRAEGRYLYDIAERGLRGSERGELAVDHIKFLRIIAVKPLRVVAQIGGTESIQEECFVVARQHAALE